MLPARLNKLAAAALAFLLCLAPLLASAEDPIVPPVGSSAEGSIDDKALQQALQFVSKATGLPIPEGSIPIVLKPKAWLYQSYFGSRYQEGMEDDTDRFVTVRALHLDGTVFLEDGFDPVEDGQVLVHELVHALQHAAGQFGDGTFDCPRQSEWEAYRASDLWLLANGRGDEITDPFWLVLFSTCGGYRIHPR